MITDLLPVSRASLPGEQSYGGQPFPMTWVCQAPQADLDQALAWVAANRGELIRQASAHGVVLLRDFPVNTAEDFDRLIAACELPNFPYDESLSNAVRVNRTPRVFTANEAPPTVAIYLHHEMAQTPVYPSRLFFFCEQPAESGGATPVCRSDVLWEQIVEACPQFAQDCAAKGLRYTNVMPPEADSNSGMGRSWQSTLRATDKTQAEQRLRGLGYEWEWLPDGCLRATTPVLPAVRELGAGRRSFFNQLIAAYHGWRDTRNDPGKAIRHGDGTPLDAAAVATVSALADRLTFDVPWQRGDVALVDNFVAMHGRRPFVGTRRVLASLIAHD